MTETLKNKKTKSYTQYGVKRNWQLLAMLSRAIVFTAVFAYIPMYGILIAFQEYNPALGIGGSPYIGLDNFTRFFESYQFSNLMINTFLVILLHCFHYFPTDSLSA